MSEQIHIISPDISCDHCRATIEHEIGRLPGIEKVTVEIPSKRVDVAYDPARTDANAILSRLEDEGYPPTEWDRD